MYKFYTRRASYLPSLWYFPLNPVTTTTAIWVQL